jgi:ribonuclease BN (tRNA processing enzyme)
MRLTIIGAGTSAPQPETPASGILVETASTALLIDCGQGVIRGLMAHRDPRDLDAIIVGHLHADHYIDLVSLRYLMPWTGFTGRRIPVLLPPGGRARVDQLAAAISEREGFFDHTFDVQEYDPAAGADIGDLRVDYIAGRHYVPAWGCSIADADGARVVISGDTGPNEALDVLVAEATLLDAADDDLARGHLTVDEAIDIGVRAGVGRTILVHYRTANVAAISKATRRRPTVSAGAPGLTIDVLPRRAVDGASDQSLGGRPAGIASSASRARCR